MTEPKTWQSVSMGKSASSSNRDSYIDLLPNLLGKPTFGISSGKGQPSAKKGGSGWLLEGLDSDHQAGYILDQSVDDSDHRQEPNEESAFVIVVVSHPAGRDWIAE